MNQLIYIIGLTMQRGVSSFKIVDLAAVWNLDPAARKLSALNVRISVDFEYFEVWFFVNIFIYVLEQDSKKKKWGKFKLFPHDFFSGGGCHECVQNYGNFVQCFFFFFFIRPVILYFLENPIYVKMNFSQMRTTIHYQKNSMIILCIYLI